MTDSRSIQISTNDLISFLYGWEIFHYVFRYSSAGKESACNAGDLGSILWLGRSPGERKGCSSQPLFPLQYSGLEDSLDCIIHGVAESDTTEWFSLPLWTINIFSCETQEGKFWKFLNWILLLSNWEGIWWKGKGNGLSNLPLQFLKH